MERVAQTVMSEDALVSALVLTHPMPARPHKSRRESIASLQSEDCQFGFGSLDDAAHEVLFEDGDDLFGEAGGTEAGDTETGDTEAGDTETRSGAFSAGHSAMHDDEAMLYAQQQQLAYMQQHHLQHHQEQQERQQREQEQEQEHHHQQQQPQQQQQHMQQQQQQQQQGQQQRARARGMVTRGSGKAAAVEASVAALSPEPLSPRAQRLRSQRLRAQRRASQSPRADDDLKGELEGADTSSSNSSSSSAAGSTSTSKRGIKRKTAGAGRGSGSGSVSVSNTGTSYLAWTAELDERLEVLTERQLELPAWRNAGRAVMFKTKFWIGVAEQMPQRTPKQCRERWKNALDPGISHAQWSLEEDMLLLKHHAEVGNRWSVLSSRLPGRTENGVKTRCKSIARARKRRWDHEEDARLRQLFSKLGPRWVEIKSQFPARTIHAVKQRHRALVSGALKKCAPGSPEQSLDVDQATFFAQRPALAHRHRDAAAAALWPAGTSPRTATVKEEDMEVDEMEVEEVEEVEEEARGPGSVGATQDVPATATATATAPAKSVGRRWAATKQRLLMNNMLDVRSGAGESRETEVDTARNTKRARTAALPHIIPGFVINPAAAAAACGVSAGGGVSAGVGVRVSRDGSVRMDSIQEVEDESDASTGSSEAGAQPAPSSETEASARLRLEPLDKVENPFSFSFGFGGEDGEVEDEEFTGTMCRILDSARDHPEVNSEEFENITNEFSFILNDGVPQCVK